MCILIVDSLQNVIQILRIINRLHVGLRKVPYMYM